MLLKVIIMDLYSALHGAHSTLQKPLFIQVKSREQCQVFVPCSCLQVELSQDDLKMLLRILMENLGEASGPQPASSRQEAVVQLQAARGPSSGPTPRMPVKKRLEAKIRFPFWGLFLTRLSVFVSSDGTGKSTEGSKEEDDEALETLKFNFNIESLGLVLYNNPPKQVSGTRIRSRRRFSVGFLLKNLVLISLQPFFRPTVMSSSDQLTQFPFCSKSTQMF